MKIPPLSIKVENKQQEQAVCRVLESAGKKKKDWGDSQYEFGYVIVDHHNFPGYTNNDMAWTDECPKISYTDFMAQYGVTNYSNSMLNQENCPVGTILVDSDGDEMAVVSVSELGVIHIVSDYDPEDVGCGVRFSPFSAMNKDGWKIKDETVKEMTVEEVSKLVGTKVKIVEG